MNKNKGFTLAEVLITIGVIGVVAVLTIQSVITKQREKTTIVKLQKAYSILNQALQLAIEDNGTVDDWCTLPLNRLECSLIKADKFAEKLKVVKRCKTTDTKCAVMKYYPLHKEAWHVEKVSIIGDYKVADNAILNTEDGFTYYFGGNTGEYEDRYCTVSLKDANRSSSYSYHNHCGRIYVDINGTKGPNVYGKDLFEFKIFKDGIKLSGVKGDYDANGFNMCAQGIGAHCSGWVIQNQNMDYLHCPDKLGWDKALSCK